MAIIASIDAETDPFEEGKTDILPFCWGFYDGERYREFWNMQDNKGREIHCATKLLLDFLESYPEPLILYAHNGGKFDFHFILKWIKEYTEIKIINGRIVKVKIGKHELRDSYSLLPVPLGAYKKDKIDYDIMRASVRFLPGNVKLISDYLESDCRYLREMVCAFIEKYGMHLTMASASMKVWEKMRKAADPDFKAPRTNKHYYASMKDFYYGGRVQCFQTGIIEKSLKYRDINSAYPFGMLHKHPLGTTRFDHGPIAGKRLERMLARDYMGNLFWDVEGISRGALPYRGKDGGLYYPADYRCRRYRVTGWEIKAALETGTFDIKKVRNVMEYDLSECEDFSDYILKFYQERMEAKEKGDDAMKLFTKLFMNSLYGKFGANPDEYRHYMVAPYDLKNALIFGPMTPDEINAFVENDLDEWEFGGDLGPHVLCQKALEEHEKNFFNVATAASITGFVRAYLWRAICAAKGVVYCDTDSIIAEDFADDMPMGAKLGEWENVAADDNLPPEDFIYAAVGGRKMYALKDRNGNWKKASKGAKLTIEQLIEVAQGKTVLHKAIAPTFSIRKAPVMIDRRIRMVARELTDE